MVKGATSTGNLPNGSRSRAFTLRSITKAVANRASPYPLVLAVKAKPLARCALRSLDHSG